ncbi:hypothetical protein SCLCIDRAFT_1217384 [Scleroderma citrinum Foug A]|uniref:Uncharacterized protein n=1 Tax=Scleroderma citrinum Foug A TaxID=1036808 RepID=A0A0C2ZDS8_9AGAM|nr:hypothetical protein SCLCIDRAFT_1217384 [Scleroderma citrinum Foug A]
MFTPALITLGNPPTVIVIAGSIASVTNATAESASTPHSQRLGGCSEQDFDMEIMFRVMFIIWPTFNGETRITIRMCLLP